MKCAWCNKEIREGDRKVSFTRSTYYQNYKRSHTKKVHWHEDCYNYAEYVARENRIKQAEELRKEIEQLRDNGEIDVDLSSVY